MSTEDRSNTTKKSTVYVALITALAIIIGSVILGIGGQTPKTVITFKTNLGEIVISTKSDEAPQTVAAISKLAQENYFDNTICHRLTTEGIFVLQCGDPTGTGTGGPGFTIPDENLPQAIENNYPVGTVAMANSGPNSSGSQFFLVYQDTTLPNAAYTIWGSITSGLDILKTIASAGVVGGGADGAPVTGVTIESTKVTIS
jgi:peptidyl-prolyl cis-trans isomerase B (cyclophilin B)